jgi:hypothetical protein
MNSRGESKAARPADPACDHGWQPRRALNWRKSLHQIHRDLGYFFFGATIVYACSGVFLNHRNEWKLTYPSSSRRELVVPAPGLERSFTPEDATNLLAQAGIRGDYLGVDTSADGVVSVLFQGGSAKLDRKNGRVVVETIRHRPLPFILTFIQLHFNPGRWWTWFADSYCTALILMAVSGLFLLRGHQGLARRGGVLVLLGLAIPIILVLFHL